MKKTAPEDEGVPAAQLIDRRIAELTDWRGKTLARMRQLIREAAALNIAQAAAKKTQKR